MWSVVINSPGQQNNWRGQLDTITILKLIESAQEFNDCYF